MAIEFRCPQCGKLLRTADDTAGKQAKCPACGTAVTIPAAGTTDQYGVSPATQPQGPNAATPPAMGDNPYASPAVPPLSAAPENVGGDIVPTRIDVGDAFSRTWTIFKGQMGMCIGVAVVAWLINAGVQMTMQMAIEMAAGAARDEVTAVMLAIVAIVVNTGVSTWIGAGQVHVFLRIARGERPEFSELFSGARWFWKILGSSILFGLMCLVGYVLCIVPGVIVALMFSQYRMLIIDRNVGVMDSLRMSKTITTGNKLTLFVIGLALFGLAILAAIPCFLGFIIAVCRDLSFDDRPADGGRPDAGLVHGCFWHIAT